MCRGATLDGEPMIKTVAQHAVAAAIVKKLPPTLAAKVIEQMLQRDDPLAWLEGQQQCFPERIHVSPMFFENALMARLTWCNVARQILQASGYLPVRIEGYSIDGGLKEQLAELLEDLRSQQFHGNKKVLHQKMVVIGDTNAEELSTACTGGRILDKSVQGVVSQLYDIILGGSVRLAIIAVGRDDIFKGTPLDQCIGSVKAMLEMLAEFKHVKAFILPPPWMHLYTAEYRAFIAAMHVITGSGDDISLGEHKWTDETKEALKSRPKGTVTFLHRYKGRDFVEMSRWGGSFNVKWSDGNGHARGRRLVLGSRKDAPGGQAYVSGGGGPRGGDNKRTYWASGHRKDAKDHKRDRRSNE